MASHDQSYKAGETNGQTQEKARQMIEGAKDKAQAANDKASGATQATKDETQDTTQAAKDRSHDITRAPGDKAHETKEQIGRSMEAAKEKMSETTQCTQDTVAGMEKTGGIIQATTEQVKSAAAGAVDAMNQTLGMGVEQDKSGRVGRRSRY